MVFVSAGHNSQSKTIKQDPGAVNPVTGIKEGDLTIEFRDLVKAELTLLGVRYISDTEEENLAMYLNRIRTGNGSVVIEYHFDSASNPKTSGTTSIVEEDADRLDRAFAREIADSTANILLINNRGVISEKESHRGRLGLMREQGIITLCEIGFVSNEDDIAKYHARKLVLAKAHALIIKKYESIII